jgi:cytoskeletal protein CcmA (bactofilin family)
MPLRGPALAAAFSAVFVLASLSSTASAAVVRGGGKLVIAAADTVRDDLYISGGKLDIEGVVLGDVIACGGDINVGGTVHGDLLSAGGSTTISGTVDGTARCAGGQVRLMGNVGEDLVVGCGHLRVASGARVGRDVLVGAGESDLDGDVGRDVFAGAGDLSIAGHVGGGVRARAERIRLGAGARVERDFEYTSRRAINQSAGATVGGKITQRLPHGRRAPGPVVAAIAFMFGWVRSLVGALAIGLLVVLPFPAFGRRTLEALAGSPGPSLGVGAALLIGVPLVTITLVLLGFVIGGWWLPTGALVLFGLTIALGFTMTGVLLGQRVLGRAGSQGSLIPALLAGVAILTLVSRLPVLGVLVGAVAAVFGLGALAIAVRGMRAGAGTPATT